MASHSSSPESVCHSCESSETFREPLGIQCRNCRLFLRDYVEESGLTDSPDLYPPDAQYRSEMARAEGAQAPISSDDEEKHSAVLEKVFSREIFARIHIESDLSHPILKVTSTQVGIAFTAGLLVNSDFRTTWTFLTESWCWIIRPMAFPDCHQSPLCT